MRRVLVWAAALARVVADPRYASMCIAGASLSEKDRDGLVRRCALHVCSLLLTTAPAAPPLVLVAGLEQRHLQLLARAGAETVQSPGIAPWNSSGLVWAARPAALRGAAAPARIYTYHKLHMWDPAVVRGASRVAFVDSDAIYVRNASALLDTAATPAAFFLRDDCKPPNVAWDVWDPGIRIDGAVVKKAAAYWNTGVVVYEPDARVHADLWGLYATGDFAALDPGAYVCEGDLLQTYYWRASRGTRPHALNAAWNFRGYKCSYADVARPSDIRVVHKEEKRAVAIIFESCEGGRPRGGDAKPAFLRSLLASLDAGQCASPAAAARLRETCPDAASY